MTLLNTDTIMNDSLAVLDLFIDTRIAESKPSRGMSIICVAVPIDVEGSILDPQPCYVGVSSGLKKKENKILTMGRRTSLTMLGLPAGDRRYWPLGAPNNGTAQRNHNTCAEFDLVYGIPWKLDKGNFVRQGLQNIPDLGDKNLRKNYAIVSFSNSSQSRKKVVDPCPNCASWVMCVGCRTTSTNGPDYHCFGGAVFTWDTSWQNSNSEDAWYRPADYLDRLRQFGGSHSDIYQYTHNANERARPVRLLYNSCPDNIG